MKFSIYAHGSLVATLLGCLIWNWNDPTIITILTPGCILITGFVALLTFQYTRARNHSSDYLHHGIEFMRKAYTMFEDSRHSPTEDPSNDRILWLTVARNIKTALDLKSKVTEPSHKKIFEEEEQWYRHKFYVILRINDGSYPEDYYADKPEHTIISNPLRDRLPIALSSIHAIYTFADWPDKAIDPLEGEGEFTKEEAEKMARMHPKNLGGFLLKVHEAKRNILSNK